MQIEMLPGKVLVTRDPIEDRSPGGIWYPDKSRKLAVTGLCHLHTPGAYWYRMEGADAIPLTGAHIVFEKWAGRPFTTQGITFWVIPEESVLGLTEESAMKRDMLKQAIMDQIDEVVPVNRELTDEDVNKIQDLLDNDQVIDLANDLETDEEEGE